MKKLLIFIACVLFLRIFFVQEVRAVDTGSCCNITTSLGSTAGTCTITTEVACTSPGTWTLNGLCSPNPCPQSGSCCETDGTCTVTLEAACTDTWTESFICDPNPCIQPAALPDTTYKFNQENKPHQEPW